MQNEPKTIVKVVYNQKQLLALIVDKHNLDPSDAHIKVSHYPSNQREGEYTEVVVEAKAK
jgi:hypothetical protein